MTKLAAIQNGSHNQHYLVQHYLSQVLPSFLLHNYSSFSTKTSIEKCCYYYNFIFYKNDFVLPLYIMVCSINEKTKKKSIVLILIANIRLLFFLKAFSNLKSYTRKRCRQNIFSSTLLIDDFIRH